MFGKSCLLVTLGLVFVGLSVAAPQHRLKSSSTPKTVETTVKILIPSPSSTTFDDTVVVEAAKDDEPFRSEPDQAREFDPSDCFLEKSKGPCRAVIDSFFFNSKTQRCELFAWSGCGGNNNRFSDLNECQHFCGKGQTAPPNNAVSKLTIGDAEPAGSDPVPANVSSSLTVTCPEFKGCGPIKCSEVMDPKTGCMKCSCVTGNPVPPKVQVSSPGITVTNSKPKLPVGSVSGPASVQDDDSREMTGMSGNDGKPDDICKLPPTRGHCRAMLTRWMYDSKLKDCIQFHFGGCDGNGNNFVSKPKCMEFCKGQ